MPIPQVKRINPLDLQKNIAIGISLPFNGRGVFNNTFSTKDQIKSNIINLLLTNKGERIMNPDFGADIKNLLFEGMTDDLKLAINEKIVNAFNMYIPQASINNININFGDDNSVNVTVNYIINISNVSDQVILEFQ
jgi:phage baseplate assembly protein W